MAGAPAIAQPLAPSLTPSMAALTGKSFCEKSARASTNLAAVWLLFVPEAHFSSNSLRTKLPSGAWPGPKLGKDSSGRTSSITPVMFVIGLCALIEKSEGDLLELETMVPSASFDRVFLAFLPRPLPETLPGCNCDHTVFESDGLNFVSQNAACAGRS